MRRLQHLDLAAKITFQASPGTSLERIFSRHFDGFDSWLLGGKSLASDFPVESLRCTYCDLDTF